MKMSSLVDSTYRSIVSRLQRGGTAVKAQSRPSDEAYKWGFSVYDPDACDLAAVSVTVEILTKNVYKNDKVRLVVDGRAFDPLSGNCPPLDMVEAYTRFALLEKIAIAMAKSSSTKSEPVAVAALVVEVVAEPEDGPESPRKRRGKRHAEAPEEPG